MSSGTYQSFKTLAQQWKLWRGTGRNSDNDVRTFRNCDMTRFELQTGDMHTPPNRASTISCWFTYKLSKRKPNFFITKLGCRLAKRNASTCSVNFFGEGGSEGGVFSSNIIFTTDSIVEVT